MPGSKADTTGEADRIGVLIVAVLKLADPASPTLIEDKDGKNALYVLMPMRV